MSNQGGQSIHPVGRLDSSLMSPPCNQSVVCRPLCPPIMQPQLARPESDIPFHPDILINKLNDFLDEQDAAGVDRVAERFAEVRRDMTSMRLTRSRERRWSTGVEFFAPLRRFKPVHLLRRHAKSSSTSSAAETSVRSPLPRKAIVKHLSRKVQRLTRKASQPNPLNKPDDAGRDGRHPVTDGTGDDGHIVRCVRHPPNVAAVEAGDEAMRQDSGYSASLTPDVPGRRAHHSHVSGLDQPLTDGEMRPHTRLSRVESLWSQRGRIDSSLSINSSTDISSPNSKSGLFARLRRRQLSI